MSTKTVLWLSYDPPSQKELDELYEELGGDVAADRMDPPTHREGFRTVLSVFRCGNYDDVVATCRSAWELAELYFVGLHPLWAEPAAENDPKEADFRDDQGQGCRFVRYRRVKEVRVIFEDGGWVKV